MKRSRDDTTSMDTKLHRIESFFGVTVSNDQETKRMFQGKGLCFEHHQNPAAVIRKIKQYFVPS